MRGGPQFFLQTLTDAQGKYVPSDIPMGFKNGPNQVGITASAANFNPQSRTITIFCGATIVMDFGRPATAFSAVEGHVTNPVNGQPIGGAFVGSEFGGSTSTDAQGFYRLNNVPLGADDAPRDWKITVQPQGFNQHGRIATVRANQTTTLDFAFGGTTTHRLTFVADGIPAGIAWVPSVDGSALTQTDPGVFPVDEAAGSVVGFSAPSPVAGAAGTRYVLHGWTRANDGRP